ncbi:hypothetical protein I317_03080 [Kwoniella heveanensis CBS 569]|nr:hypothetical protein I317_03080 [Kwoniella heveanensis CBS 569]
MYGSRLSQARAIRAPLTATTALRNSATKPRHLARLYSSPSTPSGPSGSPNVKTTAFVSIALLASAYALYSYEQSSTSSGSSASTDTFKGGEKFTLNIRTSRGPQAYEFLRRSSEDVERILTEHETGEKSVGRSGNPVIRWDTNWVGSNEPCEDRWASNLIPRKQSSSDQKTSWLSSWYGSWPSEHGGASPDAQQQQQQAAKKDLMLFSIMDGHAGDATSKLLEKTLHPTLAVALAGLQAGYVPEKDGWKRWTQVISPTHWAEFALGKGNIWTPENVTKTIQNAYLQLDEHICQAPIRLLPTLIQNTANPSEYPTARQTLVALAQPAAAGACSITTLVDAENEDLYVALAGDCRAVAGWQGVDGKWRCDTLTEDQMGENPREVERMKSEHPASERDTVIKGGRVQGGLQPTRAFGDAVYKWTSAEGAAIADAFREEGDKPRPVRPWNYTPPYVTARPEVTYRKLRNERGERLRFIIMATDGLWDRLTSEEATLLLASYLAHPKHADIAKTTLPTLYPLAEPTSERPYPAQDLPQPKGESWAFEGDNNAATHLIRNSLAGADRKSRAELLSLSGKVSRWMRDDVTVT